MQPNITATAGQVLRLHLVIMRAQDLRYRASLLTEEGQTLVSISDLPTNIKDTANGVTMKLPVQGWPKRTIALNYRERPTAVQ